MRVFYEPEQVQFWTQVLLQEAAQTGSGLPGFSGLRFQRGAGLGSFLSGLFRLALPIVKSAGKAIGKQTLASGVAALNDIVSGSDPKHALQSRGREALGNLLSSAGNTIKDQSGSGVGILIRKRKRSTVRKTKTKRSSTAHKRRKVVSKKKIVKRRKPKTKKNILDSI
jgi:hypothetical protein